MVAKLSKIAAIAGLATLAGAQSTLTSTGTTTGTTTSTTTGETTTGTTTITTTVTGTDDIETPTTITSTLISTFTSETESVFTSTFTTTITESDTSSSTDSSSTESSTESSTDSSTDSSTATSTESSTESSTATSTDSTTASSTDSSSTTSSTASSTSSAAGQPTNGPEEISAIPAGAVTDSPFGNDGFFLTLPGAAGRKRQTGGFIGGGNCGVATRFDLQDGVLTADGVAYGAGPDQTAITFTAARGAGGVQTTWFIEADGSLGWFNDSFYNNQAGFCSNGNLFITFITPAAAEYPENCVDTALEAIDASRCVNGEIVPIGGPGCQYPIGIPRGEDFYLTGCPTPSGESCVSTTVSWIPGQLTFLPKAEL